MYKFLCILVKNVSLLAGIELYYSDALRCVFNALPTHRATQENTFLLKEEIEGLKKKLERSERHSEDLARLQVEHEVYRSSTSTCNKLTI